MNDSKLINDSKGFLRLRNRLLLVLLVAFFAPGGGAAQGQVPSAAAAAAFPEGKGLVVADFDGTALNLHSYKPANYTGERFILLFHGASRTASRYRDNAAGMAEAFGFLVVVPEFDLERFPSRLYQFGGVFREDGSVAGAEERTYAFVPKLVDFIRGREGDAQLPYLLVGFSAGGQFVGRMAAFLDTDAERIVAMSAGSCMFPTRELQFGLGFGGLPDELSNDLRIQRYLSLPITIYIGTADTETAQLPTGAAYAQGVHRYSRNIRWFNQAMDLAYEREWEFNWRLVIADGPGHSPPDMFNHPQTENALFGPRR
jgi:alpha-beta hydrolase superfamily lysophospholipase